MKPVEHPIRVVNLLPDPRIGGPQIRVGQLALAMRKYGVETTVMIPPGTAVQFFQSMQVPCIPFAFPRVRRATFASSAARTGLGLPYDSWRLAKLLRQNGTSILHCNGLMTLIGPLAGRLAGVKTLWHLNDTFIRSTVYSMTLRTLERFVDRIVFSSHAVGRHARCSADGEVVYPPVDLNRFGHVSSSDRNALLFRHDLDPETPTIVSIGNVNRSKGYDHLLAAIALLKQQNLPLQAIIVGDAVDPSLQDSLLAYMRCQGIDSVVRFVGPKRAVEEYIGAATVFVLPSTSEAMPVSLLEAMVAGVPCVATRVGGVEEVLKHRENGLLVSVGRPDQLADAIREMVLNRDAAIKMGTRASLEVSAKCDLEIIARQQAGIYFAMLDPTLKEFGCFGNTT